MLMIIVKRPRKAIGEADARAPAGDCAKSAAVGYYFGNKGEAALIRLEMAALE
jgi:hypothetical protein